MNVQRIVGSSQSLRRACHTTASMCQRTHLQSAQTIRNTLSQPTDHSANTPGRFSWPGSASSLQPLYLLHSRSPAAPPAGSVTPPLRAQATATAPLIRRIPQCLYTI